MNELLQSIRADLLSRRMLPLVAAVALGLLGAVAYAVSSIAGGGSAKPPAITSASLPAGAGSLPVTPAPANPREAVSETPAGARYQTRGATRDPFKSLIPTPAAKATAGASAQGTSPNTSKSVSVSPGNTGGGATPTTAPARPAPAPRPRSKPRPVLLYNVSVLFGLAPSAPGQQPTLTPYEDMKLFEPLPAAKTPLVVFIGVNKAGDHAAFALVVPAILRGPGKCVPSDTQCQAIELAAGQSEELEYAGTSEQSVAFELQVVRIAKRSSPAGAAQAVYRRQSKVGRRALSRLGLQTLKLQ